MMNLRKELVAPPTTTKENYKLLEQITETNVTKKPSREQGFLDNFAKKRSLTSIHDKNNPLEYQEKKEHKRRPYLIEEGKRQTARCFNNPYICDFGQTSFHLDKRNNDNGLRKIRSEFRDIANCIVPQTLLHHVNFQEKAVGFYDNKGRFISLAVEFLYREAKNSLIRQGRQEELSYNRFREAVRVLEDHGYISIKENRKKRIDDRWESMPATISVNMQWFIDLGFTMLDISRACKDEFTLAHKANLATLKIEHYNNKRFIKKEKKQQAKQEIKKIHYSLQELIQREKKGLFLTEEQQQILKHECSGHDRRRNQDATYYPEFTDGRWLDGSPPKKDPSSVGKESLRNIMDFLKKPPS